MNQHLTGASILGAVSTQVVGSKPANTSAPFAQHLRNAVRIKAKPTSVATALMGMDRLGNPLLSRHRIYNDEGRINKVFL